MPCRIWLLRRYIEGLAITSVLDVFDTVAKAVKNMLHSLLKENIIIGHLIPAGTGIHRYQNVEFMVEQSYYDEEIIPLTGPEELVPGLAMAGE